MISTIDFEEWMVERRHMLAPQVRLLQRRARRTHRPRSREEWDVLTLWVKAELARRQRNGDWTWIDDRTVVVR
jgi:hypothetical protein